MINKIFAAVLIGLMLVPSGNFLFAQGNAEVRSDRTPVKIDTEIVPPIPLPTFSITPSETPQDTTTTNVDQNVTNISNTSDTVTNTGVKGQTKGGKGDAVKGQKKDKDEEKDPDEPEHTDSISDKPVENPNTIKTLLPDIDTLTGSLVYKYPIALPPGRNNLTPDLSLIYNSGASENSNILGYGWSIQLPYIERVNRKGANLFYSTSTTVTSTFASSLSGELVPITGTSTYQSRVEDGSFIKYETDGSKWTATDKNGTKYFFGTTTSSRLNNSATTTNIYKWMVEEIRDTNDNFISFSYTKNNNEIYPSAIIYTGNGTTTGIFEIDFVYDGRNDSITSFLPAFQKITANRLSKIQIKINGSLTKEYLLSYSTGHNTKRSLLSSVIASSTGLSLLPTQFTYQAASTTPKFNVSSYQLPSHQSTTTGDYRYHELDSKTQLIDVNGDSLPDFVDSSDFTNGTGIIPDNTGTTSPRVYLNTGSGWEFNPSLYQFPTYYSTTTLDYHFKQLDASTKLFDVNGDGLPDIVDTNNWTNGDGIIPDTNGGPSIPRVYLNTGSGWTFNPSLYQLPSYYDSTTRDYHYKELDASTQMLDVNGDGLPDYVDTNNYATTTNVILYNTGDVPGIPRVYLNTGTGWTFDPTRYQLPYYYDTTSHDYHFKELDPSTQLLDVNGDGLPDYVDSNNWTNSDGIIHDNNDGPSIPRTYINNGHGWEFNPNYYQLPSYYATTTLDYHFSELDSATQLIDLNGDGLPDYVDSTTFLSSTSSIPDNNGFGPRTYMNNGVGWAFSSTTFQLPSYFSTTTNEYSFRDLNSARQFIDINGDSLPDFVDSTTFTDADGIIPDNNGPAPRVYVNTGNSFTFSSTTYQLPAYYSTTTLDYHYDDLNYDRQMNDVNGDGLPDFIDTTTGTSPDGIVHDNYGNVIQPRAYVNPGKASDYLARVSLPEGGTISFNYQLKNIGGPNPSREPFFPQSLYVVKDLVTNDGNGVIATTSYSYNNGEYHYNPDQFKQFAGFGRVDKTDPVGNISKTYFHQGNTSSTTIGEYDDTIAKAGRAYRVEQYDSSGNLYTKTINRWDKTAPNATSTFVMIASTTAMTYDGDSDHKDKAESYMYSTTTGNLSEKIEWGEVTGSDDGSFTDTGTDKFTTAITYAASSTPHILGLPSSQTVTDQGGNKVRESRNYYDTLSLGSVNKGNLTKQEMWKSGTTSPTYIDTEKTYNNYGLVTQEKDPRDKTTDYTYDSFNLYPATSTNALSQSTAYTYEYLIGKPNQVIDPNGFKFQTTYDALGRVTVEKQPDISTPTTTVTKTSYTYTDNTFPTSVHQTDFLDGSIEHDTYIYNDGLGRVTQKRKEAEDTNTYSVKDTVYGPLGIVARETLPYFGTGASTTSATSTSYLYISYAYDPLKRITTVANALGTTTNTYDDWKLTVTDADGKIKDLYKDAYENLKQVDEHNGASTYSTYYEYNGNKNLTKITDALGNIRNFTYDGLGRRLTAEDLHYWSDLVFGNWTFVYDDSGNLATTTDPKSQTITHTYDDLNRPLTENYTGAAGTEITYAYDSCTGGIGKLCSATTTDAGTHYQYNALGQVKKETKTINSVNYVTEYTFNRVGKPTLIIYPDNSQVSYEYNNANLIEKVKQKEALIKGFTDVVRSSSYSPLGQIATRIFNNNATSTYTYDATKLYRLSNKTTLGASNVKLQDISYIYDAVGNITKITDVSDSNSKKTVDYTYDDLHRIASASSTNIVSGANYNETYTYNAIGNITNKSDIGGFTYAGDTGGSYANPHAVTSVAGAPFAYDNNGNLTGTGSATSTWNYRNQLTQIDSSATTTAYGYDQNGERVKYTVLSGTATIIPNRLYDTIPSASSGNQYIYADDELVATLEKNGGVTKHYVHNDHLTGSNIQSNSSGTSDEVTDYLPFGKIRLDQASTSYRQKSKYTGHLYDSDTSLTYMGARYYDGSNSRFASQDPVFNSVGNSQGIKSLINMDQQKYLEDPQSMNSYSYARNNPLKYVDPNGLYNFLTGQVQYGDTLGMITQFLNGYYGTSYSVAQIAKLNGIQDINKIMVGQIILPNMTYPDVSKSLKSVSSENAKDSSINEGGLSGIKNFYNKVKSGAEWDFKNNPDSQFYAGRQGQENYKPFFVFDGNVVGNDFPGNFNYGHTGASTWWGNTSFLLEAAGAAQVVSDIGRWQSPSWSSPYFDNSGDSGQIMQGINYHNNH